YLFGLLAMVLVFGFDIAYLFGLLAMVCTWNALGFMLSRDGKVWGI
ncbi:hypothetical protein Taro_048022, partial [Colocasia esculenta]|nr:hypothetical protein [Colocasia esculenta]